LLQKSKTGKRLIVLSTPKYVVDKEKNICKNLLKIKDKVPFVEDIVKWLIYSHRRNNILSTTGETGWLVNDRLNVDGHISTPADTLGAVTGRFLHKDVANIPRVSTLYGKELRSLFTVDKDHFLLTADADGLENRIEGHFCYKYSGGKKYAVALEAAKPNDFHTLFAKSLNISRNDAKSVKYGLSYGQQPAGLAKNNGWTVGYGKKVFNAFWKKAAPLKELKTALEKHWEANNKKYIIGLDKRKLQARAKHVLLNLLFQNAGVTAMKRQHVILDRLLKEEGLLGNPFKEDLTQNCKSTLIIAYHDESSQALHKNLVRFKSFETKEEAEICKKELEQKGFVLSDINHNVPEICDGKYFIAYSKVITLTSKSMEMAGEYYNLNIKLTQAGQIGMNWSQTH
jgi:DNA polymerase I-like protein with 3'-5' exonuclease and polymerase domains